jgi:hypothetical protein
MTAPAIRPARHGRLLRGVRWGGAFMAVLALAALAVVGPPGVARAAGPGDSYNQMTGAGTTSSAVTVRWTQGLLNAGNQPITTAGTELSPNSDRSSAHPKRPLSFMYKDFKNLKVTVSQTQNIGHQGITVSWTGGKLTDSALRHDYLQMMECYGDSPTGPSPESCEYGSEGLLNGGDGYNIPVGRRGGPLCSAGAVPSAANPAHDPNGSVFNGCDTYEPTSEKPSHCNPDPAVIRNNAGCPAPGNLYSIPFVPVADRAHPVYGDNTANFSKNTANFFNKYNSNEVQQAITGSGGRGSQQFETLTNAESQGLGCGDRESNGHIRGCWLVIVPRGEYEPNGYNVASSSGTSAATELVTSPLSASNWAQRIQVHLSYRPLSFCSIGPPERLTAGTQVITRAVQSWQLALNQAANCKKVYSFTANFETEVTSALSTAGSQTGLGFTTIPIGSEATRSGGQAPALPPILYAPVAVTATGFGFNIDDKLFTDPGNKNNYALGHITTPIKLTPRLLAKALTQVYREDLPDYYDSGLVPGPAWSQKNPYTISWDPAFQRLNPEVALGPGSGLAPLVTEEHSALDQQVWQLIQSDPATSSWLDGTTDRSDPVVANPDYTANKPGKAPALDNFPRYYKGILDLGLTTDNPPRKKVKTSQDLIPYMTDFDSVAATVLLANNQATGEWDPSAYDSNHVSGWWGKSGIEPPGQMFMWGMAGAPDLAAYGLTAAQLCGPSGTGCVGPTVASVAKALNSATPDSKGLLHINPAKAGAGGYPLVDVVYAAVPTNQSAAFLSDYANLIHYAAGQGQTIGSAPGDLPPGYLPLTAKLKAQADAVVTKLRAIASRTPAGTTPPGSPTGSRTSPGGPGNSPGGTTGTAPGSSGSPGASPAGAVGRTPRSSPGATGSPAAHLVAGTTPQTAMGVIRWVLLAVLIIGAAGAIVGTLLRTRQIPRWLHPRWLLHRARP